VSHTPERGVIAWLTAQAIAFGAMLALVVIPANALFLDTYGAKWLPATYIAIAVVGTAASAFVARAARRTRLVRVATVSLFGIAVLYAVGVIASGRSTVDPVNGAVAGSDTIVEQIRRVRDDPSVKAIVLRVDSPGGSALASDVIWREVQLTRAVKPVIASMSDVAAANRGRRGVSSSPRSATAITRRARARSAGRSARRASGATRDRARLRLSRAGPLRVRRSR